MRRERLGDVAVAPDEDVGVAQGGEAVLGAVGLGPAEVRGPLALHLVVAHLVEAAGGGEQEAEGVLGHGAVVQSRARGDEDGRREAGGQNIVGARGEGLDPAQLRHAPCGVLEATAVVGPRHEDLGVDQVLGDRALGVVGVQGDAEAFEARDVEL